MADNPNAGHRQRLKEKYLNEGMAGLYHDYEKLELLLTYALPRGDVKPLAKELLKKFGTIEEVLKADAYELEKIKGIKEGTSLFLNFIGDLNKSIFKTHAKTEKLSMNSKNDVIAYLKNEIGFEDREHFVVLFLDSANQLLNDRDIKSDTIFKGTIDRSAVYVREIVKKITEQHRKINEKLESSITENIDETGKIGELKAKKLIEEALYRKAKSIIIAHNHPSGNTKPSKSDIELTQSIKETLSKVEIRLLDHIIVTRESYFSFLEEGLLEY